MRQNSSKGLSTRDGELVSIIMPARNAALFLEIAVHSIQSQSFSSWELLIVNDASTDATLQIANNLHEQDRRIHVLDQKESRGIAKARNCALEKARGKYIAFLDSDDIWLPDKLERQISFMEMNNVVVSYSAYERIDEKGRKLGTVIPPDEIDYKKLLKSNFIANLTGVYNVEVLGKQFFSEVGHEDYVAWLALVKKAKTAKLVDAVLGQYRVYSGSISSNKFKMLGWQWRVYRDSQSLGFFYSCWLMLCYAYYAINKRI